MIVFYFFWSKLLSLSRLSFFISVQVPPSFSDQLIEDDFVDESRRSQVAGSSLTNKHKNHLHHSHKYQNEPEGSHHYSATHSDNDRHKNHYHHQQHLLSAKSIDVIEGKQISLGKKKIGYNLSSSIMETNLFFRFHKSKTLTNLLDVQNLSRLLIYFSYKLGDLL